MLLLLAVKGSEQSDLREEVVSELSLKPMMWRHVDLVHSLLPLVSIVAFWCVVNAQSDIDGPCNTCPVECTERQCVRYWWTSMWGFIVTLVALTMDVWGAGLIVKEDFLLVFCLAITFPWHIIWHMLQCTIDGMAMLANLRETHGNDVIAPLYPWRKSHIKIIVGSKVIVTLSRDLYRENRNLNAFEYVEDEDLSEAIVIGREVTILNRFNIRLTPHGQLAFLRSNVLPPYDELKILRGNSNLGMAIASAQAIGYIYGVIVRCVQGLQVSPVEAMACVLNIVILIKGVLHNFASLGHRPLLLYLEPEEKTKFIEECKNIQDFDFKAASRLKDFKLAVSLTCGVLLAVGAYFIANFSKSCKICVIPIILLELSLVFGGIIGLTMDSDNSCILMIPIFYLNIIGYGWALFLTIKYWKGEKFDVRSSNYLSQVLPYIG